MDSPKPKRRWFRFSLRTLFVVVTVTCACVAWIGWELRVIQARKSKLAEIQLNGGSFVYNTPANAGFRKVVERYAAKNPEYKRNCSISILRRVLGDAPVLHILVPPKANAIYLDDVSRLFPETMVVPDH